MKHFVLDYSMESQENVLLIQKLSQSTQRYAKTQKKDDPPDG